MHTCSVLRNVYIKWRCLIHVLMFSVLFEFKIMSMCIHTPNEIETFEFKSGFARPSQSTCVMVHVYVVQCYDATVLVPLFRLISLC